MEKNKKHMTIQRSRYESPPKDERFNILILDSSIIDKIGYDEETKTLYVMFKSNGAKYKYTEVPKDEFINLMEAESVGNYFNQNISKKYPYTKLS